MAKIDPTQKPGPARPYLAQVSVIAFQFRSGMVKSSDLDPKWFKHW